MKEQNEQLEFPFMRGQITKLAERIYENAKEKGFYNDIAYFNYDFRHPIWVSNRLMLVTSELGEGLEGVRKRNFSSEPKSGGLGEELADAMIRIMDLAWSCGIDIEEAIIRKVEFNEGREYMHGGKAL